MDFDGKYELLIIRNKYLKNSLTMINKMMDKAQVLFSKSLSKSLGYPEPIEEPDSSTPTQKEYKKTENLDRPSVDNVDNEEIIEAKKEHKDENLKGVFKKIASQIHPDKLQNLSEFEKDYKKSLFEKARIALEVNDYYGIVEVAEELGIEPPAPNKKQIELMKKTNDELEKKIKQIQSSVLWSWYYADDQAKDLLMSKYIERLQKNNTGT